MAQGLKRAHMVHGVQMMQGGKGARRKGRLMCTMHQMHSSAGGLIRMVCAEISGLGQCGHGA